MNDGIRFECNQIIEIRKIYLQNNLPCILYRKPAYLDPVHLIGYRKCFQNYRQQQSLDDSR